MKKYLLVIALMVIGSPTVVFAEQTASTVTEEAPASSSGETSDAVARIEGLSSSASAFPFGGFIALGQTLGTGTFIKTDYVRSPYWDMTLSLRPMYKINNNVFISAQISINKELSESNKTSESSSMQSVSTKPHQTILSDTSLGIRHNKIVTFGDTGISMAGNLSVSLPTSMASQVRKKFFSLSAGVSFKKIFAGQVFVSLGSRFRKHFNKYDQVVIDGSQDGYQLATYRLGGNEVLGGGLISTGASNSSFDLLSSLSVAFIATEKLTLSVSLSVMNVWSYASHATDDLSSVNASAGRSQMDLTMGVIDLSYQFIPEFGISFGVSSAQPAFTSDNDTLRFPFWDFYDQAENYTSLYLDLVGSF